MFRKTGVAMIVLVACIVPAAAGDRGPSKAEASRAFTLKSRPARLGTVTRAPSSFWRPSG